MIGQDHEANGAMTESTTEATITTAKNVLLLLSPHDAGDLATNFCGSVIDTPADLSDLTGTSVYLCGELGRATAIDDVLATAARVFVVSDHATGELVDGGSWIATNIDSGMVPLLWHGAGVFYRRFFAGDDHFTAIESAHSFQSLTESNKPGRAHRTGLYLTPVEQQGHDLHFRLLRCSTNLSGPTEDFREVDTAIVESLNHEASFIFDGNASLNHVLAQIYPNTPATETQKQTKAAIKSHADKTKDMPRHGVMAFCTFYDGLDALEPIENDPFDYGYKSTSGMTRLEFRLKPPVAERNAGQLPEKFTVVLYPNSVFFMPLSTNRLYTHAIRPSPLDASQLPTRLGYVVRCSSAEAVHRDGSTFLKEGAELKMLEPSTAEGIDELRGLYHDENNSDSFVDYAGRFYFSMNGGDYEAPSIA